MGVLTGWDLYRWWQASKWQFPFKWCE